MGLMKHLIVILIFSLSPVFAFTLSNEGRVNLPGPEVKVIVAANTCSTAGFNSAQELASMVQESVDEYWNRIPTCALKIEVEGVSASIDTTSDGLLAALTKTPVGKILVGCSDNASLFTSSGILGVGSINTASGDRGTLLLNNRDTTFANQTQQEKLAIIAHELGHAFGLGHSGDPAALMYYAIGGKVQERLSIDDYDACSYLYPHDSPGSCSGVIPIGASGDHHHGGQASSKKESFSWKSFLAPFFFLVMLALILGEGSYGRSSTRFFKKRRIF